MKKAIVANIGHIDDELEMAGHARAAWWRTNESRIAGVSPRHTGFVVSCVWLPPSNRAMWVKGVHPPDQAGAAAAPTGST